MHWGSSQSAEGTESRSEIQGTEEGGWRGSWGLHTITGLV